MPGPGSPRLCVVLHDVAPARWAACQRVLMQLRAVAADAGQPLRLSLLVVPRLHGDTTLPPAWLRWLQRMQADGHELLLHGWTHLDESPPAGGGPLQRLRDHALRRWTTAGEGEFAALDEPEAARRLAAGLAWMHAHGLAVRGFVAPAWLLGAPGWRALHAAAAAAAGRGNGIGNVTGSGSGSGPGLRYACTRDALVRLADGARVPAPTLVFSTRSAWRRAASVAWNSALARRHQAAPLLRLELHPHDADHVAVRACWSTWLRQALRQRRAVTLGEAAAAAGLVAGPAAGDAGAPAPGAG